MFDTLVGLVGVADCTDDDLVELAAAHARAEAAHAERKLAVVAELARRRRVWGESAVGSVGLAEFVAAEVAVGLSVSTGVARHWMSLGYTLAVQLPRTRQALARGVLDVARAQVIAERTVGVADPGVLAQVETRVLAELSAPGITLTRGQAGHLVDRVVASVDPGGVRAQRQRAVADREVTVRPGVDGMATVWGLLPAADGAGLNTVLQEMAVGVCPGDPRTLAQRRADAVIALSHGQQSLGCTCGSPSCPTPGTPDTGSRRRPLVQVLVAAETLTGAVDLPGVLTGFGVLDADTVRELARDATWQRLLTLGTTPTQLGPALPGGVVADPAAYRYSPSTHLAALVRARDGHCRFPGCQITARACDLDHVTPFNHHDPTAGGLTTTANLGCLCRWHHRLKTVGRWQVTQDPDGTQHWTSPTHTQHTTTPDGLPPWGYADDDLRAPHPPSETDEPDVDPPPKPTPPPDPPPF